MKYNDYPDKYPSEIIAKLNMAYKKVSAQGLTENADVTAFNKDFFNVNSLSLVDNKVEIEGESKCELEGKLVNLLECLNKCEGYLIEIKNFDKANKKHISKLITTTQANKVELYNCCYNKQDISCDYYATTSPSFNACCANYCMCELDILEQLLGLCACGSLPLNRALLLNMMSARFACFKQILCTYAQVE